MVIEESIIYLILGILIGIFATSLLFAYLNQKRAYEIAQKVKEILDEKDKTIEYIKEEKDILKQNLKESLKELENEKIEKARLLEKLKKEC